MRGLPHLRHLPGKFAGATIEKSRGNPTVETQDLTPTLPMSRKKWTWKEVALPKDLIEKLDAQFTTGIYEASLAADPLQVEVLVALADLYARQGLVEKGIE